MSNSLQKTESNKVIIKQMLRSATSIGANLEESAGAHTRADFAYSLNISKKEARETNYWLRLLQESNNDATKFKMIEIINESEEIMKILTASVKQIAMNRKQVKSS